MDFAIAILVNILQAAACLFGHYGIAQTRNAFLEVAGVLATVILSLAVALGIQILNSAAEPAILYACCVYMGLVATMAVAVPSLFVRSLRGAQFRVALLFRLSAYIAVILAIASIPVLEDYSVQYGGAMLAVAIFYYWVYFIVRVLKALWIVVLLSLPFSAAMGFLQYWIYFGTINLKGALDPFSDLNIILISMCVGSLCFYVLCSVVIYSKRENSDGDECTAENAGLGVDAVC